MKPAIESKITQSDFLEYQEFLAWKRFKNNGGSVVNLTKTSPGSTLDGVDSYRNKLSREGLSMHGKIRSKQKCRRCGGKFTDTGRALTCPACLIMPEKYFVDLLYEGQRIKLYKDLEGYTLDSYRRANRLLGHIRYEIDNDEFDLKIYIKSNFEEFQFDKYVWAWFDRSTVKLAPSTKSKRKGFIKNYHIPFFAKKNIRKIRGGKVEDYLLDLPRLFGEIEKNKQKTMSDKQRKNVMDDLHKMFTDALRREDIMRIPVFPGVEFETPMFNWIDRETQEKILEQIHSYDRDVFRFIILTGARPGEIRALKWDCIDLKQGVIYLKRTFSDTVLKEATKTKKWRPLPITDELLEILKKQGRSISGFVFVNQYGRHYTSKINCIWNDACKKVGVDITLYNGTRHSFGSQRINEGFRLEEIGAVMGHSDVKMTKRYARILTENLRTVMEGKKKIVPMNLSPNCPRGSVDACK